MSENKTDPQIDNFSWDDARYSFWKGTFIVHGSVLPRVLPDVVVFGTTAALSVFLIQQVEKAYDVDLSLPRGPLEAVGAVLALLLVLRIDAGYKRWWEARVLWGSIVNCSRNLAIQGLNFCKDVDRWHIRFLTHVAVFPHTLRRSLRGQRNLPEMERYFSPTEVRRLSSAEHMPTFHSHIIAQLLYVANENGLHRHILHRMEATRAELMDCLGGCERILKTPLPLSGAIQVRQFIFVFLIFIPLALLREFRSIEGDTVLIGRHDQIQILFVGLFVMFLAYPLLSLDRIGMELQNPFSPARVDYLPLDEICLTIEKNVIALLHDSDLAATSVIPLSQVVPSEDAALKKDFGAASDEIS